MNSIKNLTQRVIAFTAATAIAGSLMGMPYASAKENLVEETIPIEERMPDLDMADVYRWSGWHDEKSDKIGAFMYFGHLEIYPGMRTFVLDYMAVYHICDKQWRDRIVTDHNNIPINEIIGFLSEDRPFMVYVYGEDRLLVDPNKDTIVNEVLPRENVSASDYALDCESKK